VVPRGRTRRKFWIVVVVLAGGAAGIGAGWLLVQALM
jgi:hypothetical protein